MLLPGLNVSYTPHMLKNLLFSLLLIIPVLINAGNWPGHAITGNGKFCAVYSEDQRVTSKDGYKGIRHFYFGDFTNDYVKSAHFELMNKSAMVQKDSISPYMADFFTPAAKHFRGKTQVFTTAVRASDKGLLFRFHPDVDMKNQVVAFKIVFPGKLTGNEGSRLTELAAGEKGDAYALWSNNVRFRIACTLPYRVVKQSYNSLDLLVTVNGTLPFEMMLIPENIQNRLKHPGSNKSETGAEGPFSKETTTTAVTRLKPVKVSGAWQSAEKLWTDWISQGGIPYPSPAGEDEKTYNEFYCRNLYAAYSSILNGQVPADVTGQFLTNGMPQLYPRDAMMTARNFLQCGYPEVAASVIRFWANPDIPQKTPGEFYARYDAYGKATDAGGGARFDEPEWDASAYFIILNYEYHALKGKWLTDINNIFRCAGFIGGSRDTTGLLYEGGIVEWTGYLPATNMICAAGLKKAAEIATAEGRKELTEKYMSAYKSIEAALPKLFDPQRKLYTAHRYHGIKADDNFSISEKKGNLLYLWDVTSVFGILWGYPDHPMMKQTYEYLKANLHDNGGVRYFEATDNGWLEAYGKDLFYFATAAWAKYAIMQNDKEFASKNLQWIIAQSNIYGLMPERVLSDYSGISEASPLTWGCAEFAGAVKMYVKE